MTAILWPIVALTLIGVANYRLGQYLNPPWTAAFKTLSTEVKEIKTKVNNLMMDKGFGKK